MKPIPTRLDDELLKRLDAFAEARGMTRAGSIRYILRRAFGDSALEAALAEELNIIHARLAATSQRVRGRLADIFAEELGVVSTDEDPEVEVLDDRPRALPARGEDIVEGEVLDGLRGRRRR